MCIKLVIETRQYNKFKDPHNIQVYTSTRLKMNISLNPNFTAMVTGHGRTRAYLHRFRLIDNATCPCNKEDQTVDHLIHQCTLLYTNRELVRENIQQYGNWPASKQELITKHLNSFLIFTKSINFDEL